MPLGDSDALENFVDYVSCRTRFGADSGMADSTLTSSARLRSIVSG
jgi:hypothetical protein